jgi:drug/metabolite transporter (DMT)-like permease
MGLSPLSLYTLVFLSAVAHASWNALVKNAGDRLLMMGAIRAVGLTYGLVMLPFVPWPSAVTVGWLTCATFAVFAYYGLLIQSYRIGDMSLVYPIARGSAPILLALIAFLTIDERLSSLQIAAVTLTSAGILMLVVGKGGDRIAIALAIATGISIAAYSFFGALGVRASADVLGFQAWLEILTGIGMVSFIAIRRGFAIGAFIRVHYPMGLLAGVLSVAGYLAYLAAAQILPLGPVSAQERSGSRW